MIIRNRYLKVIFISVIFICIIIIISNVVVFSFENFTKIFHKAEDNGQFAPFDEFDLLENVPFNNKISDDFLSSGIQKDCTMDLCFDFKSCKQFQIYVYPDIKGVSGSDLIMKILSTLRKSKYYTDDPNKACLFIPSLDTLHRDPLSPNFDRQLDTHIQALPFWNKHGGNHLIFNFYAGTWPNYYEHEFHMQVNRALLAKASLSRASYRPYYDISMPLIHNTHSVYDQNERELNCIKEINANKRYLLVFKGKRYLHGVGSYSRDSLHLLHNGLDMILVTTCKHGQDWIRFADKNCEKDMIEYEKYDYDELMRNSVFCLVPRGRRLGSYRFLEVLKSGCIPVMLSNDWVLPFSEVIDWNEAVVWADERLIMQIPDMLRQIPREKIAQYKIMINFLWNTYFSSIEKITKTVIEIIRDRVNSFHRNKLSWNLISSGLITGMEQNTLLEILSSNFSYPSC